MSENTYYKLRDEIENGILTGVFEPGERLDEVQLATRFGVSRTPIREALMQLSAIGLVEIRPGAAPWWSILRPSGSSRCSKSWRRWRAWLARWRPGATVTPTGLRSLKLMSAVRRRRTARTPTAITTLMRYSTGRYILQATPAFGGAVHDVTPAAPALPAPATSCAQPHEGVAQGT